MLSTANSQVYPRWGIGAELGAVSRLDAYKVFSPMGYLYTYGYVPGFTRTQGFKFTAMWQRKLRDGSPFSQQIVSVLPRGFEGSAGLGNHLSLYNRNLVKVTADYAIPIHIGDVISEVRVLGTDSPQGVVLLRTDDSVPNGDKIY
jgi:hypothetical protein